MQGRSQLLLGIVIGYLACALMGYISEPIGKALEAAAIIDMVIAAVELKDKDGDGK